MSNTSAGNCPHLLDVEVRAFADQHEDQEHLKVQGFPKDSGGLHLSEAVAFGVRGGQADASISTRSISTPTWCIATHGTPTSAASWPKLNYGVPLVLTVHSLEPLRPWKREQLGGGYDFTCWVEKTAMEMADAVVAVSQETKADVLRLFDVDESRVHIIYNGIDPQEYRVSGSGRETLVAQGIDPEKPYVLFVGRIARQKGIVHLVNAIKYFDPGFQVVSVRRRAGHRRKSPPR